jgi:hypothetical protein
MLRRDHLRQDVRYAIRLLARTPSWTGQVLRLIVREGLALGILGSGIGLAGAFVDPVTSLRHD